MEVQQGKEEWNGEVGKEGKWMRAVERKAGKQAGKTQVRKGEPAVTRVSEK